MSQRTTFAVDSGRAAGPYRLKALGLKPPGQTAGGAGAENGAFINSFELFPTQLIYFIFQKCVASAPTPSTSSLRPSTASGAAGPAAIGSTASWRASAPTRPCPTFSSIWRPVSVGPLSSSCRRSAEAKIAQLSITMLI